MRLGYTRRSSVAARDWALMREVNQKKAPEIIWDIHPDPDLTGKTLKPVQTETVPAAE